MFLLITQSRQAVRPLRPKHLEPCIIPIKKSIRPKILTILNVHRRGFLPSQKDPRKPPLRSPLAQPQRTKNMINPRPTNLIQLATPQTQNPHRSGEILIAHHERTIITHTLNLSQFTLLDDTRHGPESDERPGDLADAPVELGE